MNKTNKALCVIVPDVHGRQFWKDVKNFDCDIIFLGDYLDPYGFEGISNVDALNTFKEILDYAKENKNVQLLLGNHDCEYAISTDICDCRRDVFYYDEIRSLFIDNADLFKFALKRNYAGKDFLLSHAGFHPSWLAKHPELSIDKVCDTAYTGVIDDFSWTLCDVSYMRGGWYPAGSVVWSDIQEYIGKDLSSVSDYEQIVGHTYLKSQPVGTDNITCIDLQRIFLIDQDGNLCEKDFTPIKKYNF